jgi:hypothetical protein
MGMDDDVPFCMVAVSDEWTRGRGPSGPGVERRTPIVAADRIVEALCAAMFAPDAVLQFTGAKSAQRVDLEAVTAGTSPVRVLRCTPRDDAFDVFFLRPGQGAELRFTDEPGLHRFETQVLAGHPFAVLCVWPILGERLCRRSAVRTRVPDGAAYPRVRLPLTDGAFWEGRDVRDVSRSGLRLAVPPEVMFPLGRAARLELVLGPEHDARISLLAVARNLTCDDATGQMLYGLEFLAPALDAEMAIECFAAVLAGR